MFVVQVAADIFNRKVNFELSFPGRPTVLEVTRATEAAFSNEIDICRAENVPPHKFHVSKIKVYDEDEDQWVDLVSEGQLIDYCQLYAFQPENPWHKESQKEIPVAVKPPTSTQRFSGGQQNVQTTRGYNTTGSANGALAPYTGGRTPGSQRSEPQSTSRISLHANASNALVPKLSSDVSQEEKLRVLFSELDVKGNRVLDVEDVKQGFITFNLDFSAATVEDVFEKIDTNRDGKISFSEFERFGRLYPIMTDCLFFRSRALWDEEQIKRDIQSERLAVKQAEQLVEQARKALVDSEQDVDAARAAVTAAEMDLKDRTDRLRDLTKDMDNAKREKERAIRERKDREKDLADLKEREEVMRKEAHIISREAEKMERKVSSLSSEAAGMDERVRQLEKALDEARRAAERAHLSVQQAAREAEVSKQRMRDAVREADDVARDIPHVEDAVRTAERNVAAADNSARELEGAGRILSHEVEDVAKRRDQSEKAVEDAKLRLHSRESQLDHAKQQVSEREKLVRQREMELAEQRKQRELVSQHERVLIEQELRLREQRDSLEERETKLMSEASNFLGSLRTQFQSSHSFSRD